MPISDVYLRPDIGAVVATGRVERGRIRNGETVELVGGAAGAHKAVVAGIETFGRRLEEALEGDNVGCLLGGVEEAIVKRGRIMCKPGSIKIGSKFQAEIYMLTATEGGRQKPVHGGYSAQFYFRTADVSGTLEFPEDVDVVMPGDSVSASVKLSAPMAIEPHLRFSMREGWRTVGAGVITKVLECP